MQEFIAERNNGITTTTAIDQALMKTFKDAPAIDLAIQAGIVNEGEIVSTIEDDKPHLLPIDQLREMQEEIRELQEEQGSGVSAKISSTASSSDKVPATSEVTSAISTAVGNEATARDTAISNAINALDVSDAAVANQYVSQVSETNGKISVTRASLPTIATFTLSGTDLIITY